MIIRSSLLPTVPAEWLEDIHAGGNVPEESPPITTTAVAQDGISGQVDALGEMLKGEEGYRKDVYPDSRNIPTVGIGHKVVPSDNLKLGDQIADARVNQFFAKDGLAAVKAANAQAAQAGISDPDFIRRLAAVNFQVGPNWTGPFSQTWSKIVDGDYAGAAENLGRSLWAKQTPDRVKRFQQALLALPRKNGQ